MPQRGRLCGGRRAHVEHCGDAANDTISIIESTHGVEVRIDAEPNRFFTGIDAIQVDAGDGRDDVRVYYAFYVQTDAAGAPPQAADLHVQLGAGNDLYWSDGELPPGPCRFVTNGDDGVDSIHALIGLLSQEIPAGDVQAPLTMLFDGGEGSDVIRSVMRNVNLNGATSIDMQGGFDEDVVIQSLQMVTVNAGLNFNANGGHGNDVMTFGASPGSRTTGFVPALIVNSLTRVNVDGGFGNDRIYGQVTPLISPSASLDMAFIGGELDDVFHLLLTLEPSSLLNAPSGPLTLLVSGGIGNDQLNLTVQNLGSSDSPLNLRLDGGHGNDTANVTPGIDASGWTM